MVENNGWTMGPFGMPSQSTMAPTPTPAQVSHIQQMTSAMQQPQIPPIQQPTAQQTAMMGGLFGQPDPFLPPGSSIPGAVGPTSVGGAPLNPMGPTSVGGAPLSY